MSPKVFITYSWTKPSFSERIRLLADRLLNDGAVDVILDRYDLKEGDDKNAFMERMVTDQSVTHVLVCSDKRYAEKADGRKGGVGAESLIISQKIYSLAKQSKFIPIFCEMDEEGEPLVPTFMAGRFGFDFSTPEKENENWEPLIRALHGKPIHQKPQVGKLPAYILSDERTPTSPSAGKLATFKQAVLQGRKGLKGYRSDFTTTCISFADSLRTRSAPQTSDSGAWVISHYEKLLPLRNHIVDWVILESEATISDDFSDVLGEFLEQLFVLKSRPPELTRWENWYLEPHGIFVYETFIYVVASLLKMGAFETLKSIFDTHYLVPGSEATGSEKFAPFTTFFYPYSNIDKALLAPNGQTYLDPVAELLKRHADRSDLPFKAVMESELLSLIASLVYTARAWHPRTLLYGGYNPTFPLFVRATQRKGFRKLAKILSIENASELRDKVKPAIEERRVQHYFNRDYRSGPSVWDAMNMDGMDTIS